MEKIRLGVLACCVFVYPLLAQRQFGGTTAVSAAGTVFADGGTPRLQDVIVRLCDSSGRTVMETSTSASGQFQFNGLPAGIYLLQLEAMGFQKAEVKLELTYTSQSGISVYLKPASPNSLPSSSEARISAHELSIPASAVNFYQQGKKKLYTDHNAQGALIDFRKALQQAPGFYEARYQAGMAHLALSNAQEAEKEFRKCIEDSRNKYSYANIALGTLQLDRGETEAGERQIRQGLETNPAAWMGHYQLARLEAIRGHLDVAESHAEQALQLAPATAIVYQLLANIHVRQKNYQAALNDIDAYVRLDPDSPAGLRAKEIREQLQKRVQESATR
jgi:tetratricopeptide (TPR) repeat protein